MKLAMIFGILCALCFGIYGTILLIGFSNPVLLASLSILLMMTGWGGGIFLILAIVMFIIKR